VLFLGVSHPEKGFQLLQTCSVSFLTTDQLTVPGFAYVFVGPYFELQLQENIELVFRSKSPIENDVM
jgi:hypothetical protein